MNLQTLLGVFGSIASLIGLMYNFIQRKSRVSEWILLILLVTSMVFTCISNIQLYEYKRVENEAANLIDNWFKDTYVGSASTGQIRGAAMSGFAFLERHKDYFPGSFDQISRFIHNDLDLTSKNENINSDEERAKLIEAYDLISRIIKDIANKD